MRESLSLTNMDIREYHYFFFFYKIREYHYLCIHIH